MRPLWIGCVFAFCGLSGSHTSAGVVVITGADLGVGPGGAHPTADAAATIFDAAAAALGPVSLITFESAPLGSFHNLTVAPGVSINGADFSNQDQSIRNVPDPFLPSLNGFNTTPGGSHFVNMLGGDVVFTFAQPTQFFGAYLTGVQTNFFADSITFNDGTSQVITVPGNGTSSSVGEVVFVGFIDAGKMISSVTINAGVPGVPSAGFDDIGVDDVRFQAIVPEPASWTLCSIAGAGAVVVARLRRRGRA
jgi:hypothetical protein